MLHGIANIVAYKVHARNWPLGIPGMTCSKRHALDAVCIIQVCSNWHGVMMHQTQVHGLMISLSQTVKLQYSLFAAQLACLVGLLGVWSAF